MHLQMRTAGRPTRVSEKGIETVATAGSLGKRNARVFAGFESYLIPIYQDCLIIIREMVVSYQVRSRNLCQVQDFSLAKLNAFA